MAMQACYCPTEGEIDGRRLAEVESQLCDC
jgi:hypothetical protein